MTFWYLGVLGLTTPVLHFGPPGPVDRLLAMASTDTDDLAHHALRVLFPDGGPTSTDAVVTGAGHASPAMRRDDGLVTVGEAAWARRLAADAGTIPCRQLDNSAHHGACTSGNVTNIPVG